MQDSNKEILCYILCSVWACNIRQQSGTHIAGGLQSLAAEGHVRHSTGSLRLSLGVSYKPARQRCLGPEALLWVRPSLMFEGSMIMKAVNEIPFVPYSLRGYTCRGI